MLSTMTVDEGGKLAGRRAKGPEESKEGRMEHKRGVAGLGDGQGASCSPLA